MKVRDGYLKDSFVYHTLIVDTLVSVLSKVDFDTIVCTGVSGLAVVPAVAYKLRKPFTIVRNDESAHSTEKVEGYISFKKYVIVDDFVESGETVDSIIDRARNYSRKVTSLIGVFTYKRQYFDDSLKNFDFPIYNCSPIYKDTDILDKREWGCKGITHKRFDKMSCGETKFKL